LRLHRQRRRRRAELTEPPILVGRLDDHDPRHRGFDHHRCERRRRRLHGQREPATPVAGSRHEHRYEHGRHDERRAHRRTGSGTVDVHGDRAERVSGGSRAERDRDRGPGDVG
ncbi:MAG: hypothetical protein ACXVRX_08825, partial [Solirubrobacteraceae bacterium]